MSTIPDEDLSTMLDELASSYDVPSHGPDEILAAIAELPKPKPVIRHGWFQLSAAAAVIGAGLVFLASTGGNSESAGSSSALPASTTAHAGIKRDVAGFSSNGSAAGRGGTSTKALSGTGAVAGAGVGAPAAAAPAPATAPLSPTLQQAPLAPVVNAPPTDSGEARVVKTGSIALVVKDKKVSATLKAVNQAASLEGGYIASSSSEEFGDTPSGEVTIRVPVDRYEKLVDRIRGLDAQVRTATSSGKDVTAQFTDLESQLRTLNATRDRFLTILGQTKTISEILTVQQRVDNVSGQIDRIEGQKKLLASQSDLSTLTVSVSESGDPVVKATNKPRSGISQAFTDARDGFVNGVEAIIRHSGGFLLFLICAAVVLLLGRLSWRVARRRMV